MKNIEMKVGDKIPNCKFRVRSLGEWTDTNTDTYFKDKKVILIAPKIIIKIVLFFLLDPVLRQML